MRMLQGLAVLWLGLSSLSYAAGELVEIHKNAGCECCDAWGQHMERQGFRVKTIVDEALDQTKDRAAVPKNLRSCHTATVNGYVFEGHVPPDLVRKVLKDRPKIIGLSVPGMPVGSPGMEVPSGAKAPFDVIAFDQQGRQRVFAHR